MATGFATQADFAFQTENPFKFQTSSNVDFPKVVDDFLAAIGSTTFTRSNATITAVTNEGEMLRLQKVTNFVGKVEVLMDYRKAKTSVELSGKRESDLKSLRRNFRRLMRPLTF